MCLLRSPSSGRLRNSVGSLRVQEGPCRKLARSPTWIVRQPSKGWLSRTLGMYCWKQRRLASYIYRFAGRERERKRSSRSTSRKIQVGSPETLESLSERGSTPTLWARGLRGQIQKKGAPEKEHPSCIGFTVLRGGLSPWGRGGSEFANHYRTSKYETLQNLEFSTRSAPKTFRT